MTIQYCFTDSPVGRLLLVGNHQGLLKINFQDGHTPMLPESNWRKDAAFFMTAIIQLNEYFSGKRKNPQALVVRSATTGHWLFASTHLACGTWQSPSS